MEQNLIAQAASEIAIRQALSELNTWEIEAKFTLFEHADTQGKKLMLVQDFKEILSKVSWRFFKCSHVSDKSIIGWRQPMFAAINQELAKF